MHLRTGRLFRKIEGLGFRNRTVERHFAAEFGAALRAKDRGGNAAEERRRETGESQPQGAEAAGAGESRDHGFAEVKKRGRARCQKGEQGFAVPTPCRFDFTGAVARGLENAAEQIQTVTNFLSGKCGRCPGAGLMQRKPASEGGLYKN